MWMKIVGNQWLHRILRKPFQISICCLLVVHFILVEARSNLEPLIWELTIFPEWLLSYSRFWEAKRKHSRRFLAERVWDDDFHSLNTKAAKSPTCSSTFYLCIPGKSWLKLVLSQKLAWPTAWHTSVGLKWIVRQSLKVGSDKQSPTGTELWASLLTISFQNVFCLNGSPKSLIFSLHQKEEEKNPRLK